MKRSQRLLTARPIGWTVQSFRAIVAVALAVAIGDLYIPSSSAQTKYRFTTIAELTGVSVFSDSFSAPTLNNNGEVAFIRNAPFSGGYAVYRASAGGPLVTITQVTPGGPELFTGRPDINDTGNVAFAFVNLDTSTSSAFTGTGGPLTTIFTQTRIDSRATNPSINSSGTVAFLNNSGGGEGAQQILRGNGGPVTTIASNRSGVVLNQSLMPPIINASGLVAFSTVFGGDDTVYVGNGGGLTAVIRKGDSTSLGDVLDMQGSVAFNDSGGVLVGGRATADGGQTANNGLFLVSGGNISVVATPRSGGAVLNNSGQFAFTGNLDDGISPFGIRGIFVAPLTGADPLRDRLFDPDDPSVFGSRIFEFSQADINDRGEVAFSVMLADPNATGGQRIQRIIVATPHIRWKTGTSGVFQTAGNWDPQRVPTGTDNATFDEPGTYTVSLAGNAAHRRLDVSGNGAHITLDLEGHRYRLDELHLGDPSGNFSFTLADSSGIVSVPPGNTEPRPAPGTGEAEVTNLTANGPGHTDITAKTTTQTGLIENNHIVNVQGDGNWAVGFLTVGDEHPATLMISDGGKVDSSSTIVGKRELGILSGPGKVVVSGAGGSVSTLSANGVGGLTVGDDGRGELEIHAGGEVSASTIDVGSNTHGLGVVIVDGPTAQLRQTSLIRSFMIGSQGKGTLNVQHAARVDAAGAFEIGVGAGGSSEGIVNVTSLGQLNAKSLTVGGLGKGTLSVVDNGFVSAVRSVIGPNGKLTVSDGGTLFVDNLLTVNGELLVNTTGAASVGNAGLASVGKLIIGPAGTLKGSGIIRANVDFAGGIPQFTGSRLAPANSPGTLTIEGNVVQQSGSAMEIEIGGTAAGQFDVLKVTGNATLGGDVFLKFTDGFAPLQGQQFKFLDVSGMLSGAFANVQIRNLAPGFQFDVHALGGGGMAMVALNDGVFMLPESSAWNVDASGNWSSVANWTAGDLNHAGATAVFGNKITAPRSVTVDKPITVGRIDFINANAYTIAGDNTLTLDTIIGDAQINVTSGSHTISAPLILADDTLITVTPVASNLSLTGALSAGAVNLTKAGVGSLTLNNLHAAGLTINAGTLAVAPTVAAGSVKNLVMGSLTIAGGNTPTGKLDVTNNAVIVDYPAAGPNPAVTIRDQIIAGRGGTGLGKPWNGLGITSSTAQADVAASPNSRSIGYAVNADLPLGPLTTFRGETVDPSSVLIRYTRTGDTNLDGVVNDDDVTVVGTFYAPGVSKPEWAKGDFDYNGFVDDDDVTLLGVFYNPSAPPLAAPVPGSSDIAAVPEPGTLALVGSIALVALLARGQRRWKR